MASIAECMSRLLLVLKAARNGTFTNTRDRQRRSQSGRRLEMGHVVATQSIEAIFRVHLGGKIAMWNKTPLRTREDLARAYTPGFAQVAKAIFHDPEEVYRLTIKKNAVAIITDGTAVSGIGDVGPAAALPVMEGKAMLFKQFADIDAFPLCLATKDVNEIVSTVKHLEPTFGGIMLEDISAPRCFEIEERLRAALAIPVLHDDQHATAVAATAALINALKLVNKRPQELKVVIVGVGAAGTACAKLFMKIGVENVVACDRKGALHRDRNDLNEAKRWFAENTNPAQETGELGDVMVGADVFLGVSGPGVIRIDDIGKMKDRAIIFALANPIPEIRPDELIPSVAVLATGRSDYPNQIDCGLCYPGMFRGALDCRARDINDTMKIAAAHAIAAVVDEKSLSTHHIVPSIFDPRLVPSVRAAVMMAAAESGTARTSSAVRQGGTAGWQNEALDVVG
jgi:malate dehydrogenase (oxaloacetate-decarboxylating)